MEKENVEKALTDVLKEIDEKKRKVKQSIDFIMVLRPRKNKSETPLDSVLSFSFISFLIAFLSKV